MSIYQENCTVYQPALQLPLSIVYEDAIPQNDISRTVKEVVERINIKKYIDISARNSYGYNARKMFECVLLAFALHGYASTRQLADYCRNDIRFMFIMNGFKPSHMAFHRFIKDDLKYGIEDIFIDINQIIAERDSIDTSVLYLDGTKYEANANKMTFVWLKSSKKYRESCLKKLILLVEEINDYFTKNNIKRRFSRLCLESEKLIKFESTLLTEMNNRGIKIVSGKGCRKHQLQRYLEQIQEIRKKLEKYESHFKIAKGRNSFSKIDHDATFMHMKYDYYNHTNVFKPGYNLQVGSSDGYIRHLYISSDANDVNTFIPFIKEYFEAYGKYPAKVPADAGYGSFDNYKFCKEHEIELFMKYNTYAKEKEPINDKNQFRNYRIKPDENGKIICPGGHEFELEREYQQTDGVYERSKKLYRNHNCESCPLRSKCTKAKNGRALIVNEELIGFQKEVKQNLSTDEGKELMKQRSVQAEGIFGQLKQDKEYDRLWRRGLSNVRLELYLVAIGHNIRKLSTRKVFLDTSYQN